MQSEKCKRKSEEWPLNHGATETTEMSTRYHVELPVDAARELAEKYRKSMVVILSYDPVSGLTHTTTYGIEPVDKERAADVGRQCAKLICGEGFAQRKSYEDYRFLDQGKRAQQIDRLLRVAKAARHAILSLKAVRSGMTDDALDDLVESLSEAMDFAKAESSSPNPYWKGENETHRL